MRRKAAVTGRELADKAKAGSLELELNPEGYL
jgi:hypothetical protein